MGWHKDMVNLARNAKSLGDRPAAPLKPKGKRRGPSPLTDETVALIKRDLQVMTVQYVALKYGVAPTRIGRISREECYADVKAAPLHGQGRSGP